MLANGSILLTWLSSTTSSAFVIACSLDVGSDYALLFGVIAGGMTTVELTASNVSLNTSISLYLSSQGQRNDQHIFEAASQTGTMAHSTSLTTMTLPDDFVEGSLRVAIGASSSQKSC